MFFQELTEMADAPYSKEIKELVNGAMGILWSECKAAANRGARQIVTTAQYYDGDFDRRTLDFGNYETNYCCLNKVPVNVRELLFERVKGQIQSELHKEGFQYYDVECVTEGPLYHPLYVGGRRRNTLDKANPKYRKYVRITVFW